jgi:hypothetical protein
MRRRAGAMRVDGAMAADAAIAARLPLPLRFHDFRSPRLRYAIILLIRHVLMLRQLSCRKISARPIAPRHYAISAYAAADISPHSARRHLPLRHRPAAFHFRRHAARLLPYIDTLPLTPLMFHAAALLPTAIIAATYAYADRLRLRFSTARGRAAFTPLFRLPPLS